MVGQGYTLSRKGAASATFTRPKKPNNDIGCLLLLLGIVPELLYFGLFRGTQTTTAVATTGPLGTNLILSEDDARAQRDMSRWAPETLVAQQEQSPKLSENLLLVFDANSVVR